MSKAHPVACWRTATAQRETPPWPESDLLLTRFRWRPRGCKIDVLASLAQHAINALPLNVTRKRQARGTNTEIGCNRGELAKRPTRYPNGYRILDAGCRGRFFLRLQKADQRQ